MRKVLPSTKDPRLFRPDLPELSTARAARLAAPAESKRFWMLRGCITPEKTLRAALRKGVSRVGLQARKRPRRRRSPPCQSDWPSSDRAKVGPAQVGREEVPGSYLVVEGAQPTWRLCAGHDGTYSPQRGCMSATREPPPVDGARRSHGSTAPSAIFRESSTRRRASGHEGERASSLELPPSLFGSREATGVRA